MKGREFTLERVSRGSVERALIQVTDVAVRPDDQLRALLIDERGVLVSAADPQRFPPVAVGVSLRR